MDTVEDLILARNPYNVFVIFSLKHTAKIGIYRIIHQLYLNKKVPIIPDHRLEESLPELNSPHDYQKLNKLAITRSPHNRTNSLDVNEDPDDEEDSQNKISDLEYLQRMNYRAILDSEEGVNSLSKILTKKDPHNIFYLAAKMGVGVITGKIPTRAKRIYESLFKDKKIFIIFGTDSLGVGVNLKVRNLYIPSIMKFSGSEGVRIIDNSTTRQLLERAGRDFKNIPNAFIHIAPEYLEQIIPIVEGDPRDVIGAISNKDLYENLANRVFKNVR
jgi:hypothetical protein